MGVLEAFRELRRRHADSQQTHALLRLLIVWVLLAQTTWVTLRNPDAAPALWSINGISALFSLLFFAHVVRRPHHSPRRWIAGMLHDNLAITLWLYYAGLQGALALFIYPFVTVGNGFRFGVRYLMLSGAMGAATFGALLVLAPEWRAHGLIGLGILISHVVVTAYTGVLLGHLRRTRDQLEKLATHDVLTGVPNRRLFMARLEEMARQGRPIACLYLDLDSFKAVNDRYGHEVGDQLLSTVANEILRCIRATDLLARLGGDEFTVVLTGPASREEAKEVAARIIRRIENIRMVAGHPVDTSVSIGILFMEPPAEGTPVLSRDLLRAADAAMYHAKRAGRGRYHYVDFPVDEEKESASAA